MTDPVRIPDWDRFQHYQHRAPPWIRLYANQVVDNRHWSQLSDFAARILVELWVLASKGDPRGTISDDVDLLAFRLRHDSRLLAFIDALQELARAELLTLSHDYASAVLARRLQLTSVPLSSVAVEGRSTTNQEEKKGTTPTNPPPPGPGKKSPAAWLKDTPEAMGVWEHWKIRRQEAMDANGVLANASALRPTRTRMTKLHRALVTDHNSVQDLMEAIDGCTRDEENRGKGYIDLELILRSQEHIDRYRTWNRAPRTTGGRPTRGAGRRKRTGRYDHLGAGGDVPDVRGEAGNAGPESPEGEPVHQGTVS